MAIGDPITNPVPTAGTPGTLYASELTDFLNEVKTRLESYVPISSVLVDLLDMSNNPIENLEYVHLYAAAALPAAPIGSLHRYQNNLYWVSAAGAVRLTIGAALDSTSIGGITGNYGGSNPAQFRFVDADKEFYAFDDFAGAAWAYVGGRAFDIYGGLTSTTRVRLTWAGSANPSYTLALPDTLPADTGLLTVAASGQMATDGVLGANKNITLSGTGRVIQAGLSFTSPACYGDVTSASASFNTTHPGIYLPAACTAWIAVRGLPSNALINSVVVYSNDGVTADDSANSTIYTLVTDVISGGVHTSAFSGTIAGTSTTSDAETVIITPTTPFALTAGSPLWIKVVTDVGTTRTIHSYTVGYDVT